jgi:lysophospholipase L1-like esterase
MSLSIGRGKKVLFIGDSITDAGRAGDPEGVGQGYVRMVRDWLLAADPNGAPVVVNRGISGHKVTDLAERWERDVIAECPDVLSIFIGVNDVWHDFYPVPGNGVPLAKYREVYVRLLERTVTALPPCALVLCEPSVLWEPVQKEAGERVRDYVAAVHEIGKQFGRRVIPLNAAFEAVRAARPDVAWTTDGVHPTSAGHMLIARAWLEGVGAV